MYGVGKRDIYNSVTSKAYNDINKEKPPKKVYAYSDFDDTKSDTSFYEKSEPYKIETKTPLSLHDVIPDIKGEFEKNDTILEYVKGIDSESKAIFELLTKLDQKYQPIDYDKIEQLYPKIQKEEINSLSSPISLPPPVIVEPKEIKHEELKNDLIIELKDALINGLKDALINEIKGALINEITHDLKDDIKNDIKNEVKNEVKNETQDSYDQLDTLINLNTKLVGTVSKLSLELKHIKMELLETTQKLDYVSSHVEHLYDKSFYTKQTTIIKDKKEKIIDENIKYTQEDTKETTKEYVKEEIIGEDIKEDIKEGIKEDIIVNITQENQEDIKEEIKEEIVEDIIDNVTEDVITKDDTTDNKKAENTTWDVETNVKDTAKEEVIVEPLKVEPVKSIFKIGNKSTKRKK